MAKNPTSMSRHGPTIRALDPWTPSAGRMHHLLTDDERARLAVMASIARFKKGEVIYREGDRADAIFNIISGVVSSYKKQPMTVNIWLLSYLWMTCLGYPQKESTRTPPRQ